MVIMGQGLFVLGSITKIGLDTEPTWDVYTVGEREQCSLAPYTAPNHTGNCLRANKCIPGCESRLARCMDVCGARSENRSVWNAGQSHSTT
jgi:hypothetical protein